MTRHSCSFVPLKPDRIRVSSELRELSMSSLSYQDKDEHELDKCPLCGGNARIEHSGPWCNAVCQKCGCASGSYRSPLWAAKRWNTRVCADKSGKDKGKLKTAAVAVTVEKPEEGADKPAFKPYRPPKKRVQDLPGQMLFEFETDTATATEG